MQRGGAPLVIQSGGPVRYAIARALAHRARWEISSYSFLRQSMRAACARLAPSIAIDARASALFLAPLRDVAELALP